MHAALPFWRFAKSKDPRQIITTYVWYKTIMGGKAGCSNSGLITLSSLLTSRDANLSNKVKKSDDYRKLVKWVSFSTNIVRYSFRALFTLFGIS